MALEMLAGQDFPVAGFVAADPLKPPLGLEVRKYFLDAIFGQVYLLGEFFAG